MATVAFEPAADQPLPVVEEQSVELAGAWPRFVSRIIDNLFWSYVVGFVFGLLFPSVVVFLGDVGRGGAILIGMIMLPFALLVDAVVLSLTGRSLGKLIVGLKLVDMSMQKLPIKVALERNLKVYTSGLWLGAPLLIIVGLANAHNEVKEGGITSWDETTDSRVIESGYNVVRLIIGGAIAFGLVLLDRILAEAQF